MKNTLFFILLIFYAFYASTTLDGVPDELKPYFERIGVVVGAIR